VLDAIARRGPARRWTTVVEGARASAVLVPLYELDGQTQVLLTRRAEGLRNHSGEVSFPGGRLDPGETAVDAALREAHEEIGLPFDAVEIVGELDHLGTIVSRSEIVPVVARLRELPPLLPNPHEVARVFGVPLSEFVADGVFREERWAIGGQTRPVYFFELEDETVWGATARVLMDLLTTVLGLQGGPFEAW
jgi:8-oxo-dGTP pyrophosphatase MutT (NUDIX family)